MVAKSYQALKICGEPFNVNGRPYVMVENLDGSTKRVRWYNEREYARMYPNSEPQIKQTKTAKEIFGFDKGYITIFKGDTYAAKDFFKYDCGARYANFWGWYIISTEEVPEELPEGIEAVQLTWDSVGNEDGSLKTESEIAAVVATLVYEEDPSEYQGEIGSRIETIVTLEKCCSFANRFGGTTYIHIMRDYDGDCFVWYTTTQPHTEGVTYLLKGTVKDHKMYKNTKQTVLTRCSMKEEE